jgi:hypothetical protein
MIPWKLAMLVLVLASLVGGCSMTKGSVYQPEPLEGMTAVPSSDDTKKIDAAVTMFLRGEYVIASASYYRVPADIPWIAVSKSVKNQMAAESIQQTMFAWYEPGIDFVEIYPQGKNAFAIAMLDWPSGDYLVGFYVLHAAK